MRQWEGMPVSVSVIDASGKDLAHVWGLLTDRSTTDPPNLEFGLNEPNYPTAQFPLSLDGPYGCWLGETGLRIVTGTGAALVIAIDREAQEAISAAKGASSPQPKQLADLGGAEDA